MTRYLLKRISFMIPVLLLITLINFFLYSITPGDPVTMMMNPMFTSGSGQRMTAERMQAMIETQREALGLNKPWWERYWLWLGAIAQGNLGQSMVSSSSVRELIAAHLWPTLQLNLISVGLSAVLGVGLGVLQAVRKYSRFDYTAAFLSFFFVSMPGFFLALLLIYVFALLLGWLPTGGYETVGMPYSLSDRLSHLVLPVLTLGLAGVPYIMRVTRTAMLEVMNQDYVRSARAKGLAERGVIWGHALRNCLIPVTTVMGGLVIWLFSGSVIVESVFTWPGMGLLLLRVVGERDYPVIMGIVLVTSALSVVVFLATDVVYTIVDPRVRLEK
jgi:peptide/nickel transport system permease protein